jgi:Prokaryotic E2 domain/Cysteine-rich domain, C-terminal to E2 domain
MMLALIAAPIRSSGRSTRRYDLAVREIAGKLEVRENGGSLLPRHCPQRHINNDGSFCVGLRAGEGICDAITARQWWDKLQLFLICQETAHETGDWPRYAELSHGAAGEYQCRAEEVAEELGAIDRYRDALHNNAGCIATVARRIDPTTLRPRNGRAACVCGRVDHRGRVRLRRKCWKAQFTCSAVPEFQRRKALDEFWSSFGQKAQCCGTMLHCPLRPTSSFGT